MIFKKQDGNFPSCFCMLLKCAECPPTAISGKFCLFNSLSSVQEFYLDVSHCTR